MTAFIRALILVAAACLIGACVSPRHQGPKSDHFDGRRFFNPTGDATKGFADLIRWQWFGDRQDWPARREIADPPQVQAQVPDGVVRVTFVNHATLLIQSGGFNVLTDPVWSERTSPVTWAGPKRVHEPGVPFDKLPRIDAVVISHNHYDHLDLPTLKLLNEKFSPRFFVPLGDRRLLEDAGLRNVEELDWWETRELGEIRLHFLPCQHWSARGLFDRYMSLWGSYGIEIDGRKVYFGGDAGYSEHYRRIREKWGVPDLALLPIGAYEPRWFMKGNHMNPAEAVQAMLDLEARFAIGIHFGTWQLTDEAIDAPLEELAKARAEKGIPEDRFFTLKPGGFWEIPLVPERRPRRVSN